MTPRIGWMTTLAVFLLASTLCLLCILWIRSYSDRDSIYFATPSWGGVVNSSAGTIWLGVDRWTKIEPWALSLESIRRPANDHGGWRSHVTFWHECYFSIPDWALVLGAAAAGVALQLRIRQRAARLKQRCHGFVMESPKQG